MLEKESDKMDLILDYYKDWDSYKTPVMMALEVPNEYSESLEAEDNKKLGYLWKKYQKSSK
jgi:hypothetical protein